MKLRIWHSANMNQRKNFHHKDGSVLQIYYRGGKNNDAWAATVFFKSNFMGNITVFDAERRNLPRKVRLELMLKFNPKAASAHSKIHKKEPSIGEIAGWRK